MLLWNLSTQEDLDALPVGAHIVSRDGGICKKTKAFASETGLWWAVNAGTRQLLPAALLFTPDELSQDAGPT